MSGAMGDFVKLKVTESKKLNQIKYVTRVEAGCVASRFERARSKRLPIL
jgi:hypothetical protein